MNPVLNWLKAAFAVQSIKNNEANLHCPYCGHSRFYFNFKKKIGFCHRASCARKPTLDDLVKLKGYGPKDFYVVSAATLEEVEKPLIEVELPPSQEPDEFVQKALLTRGVTAEHIKKWGIRASSDRIYVPITFQGKLLQWLGRSIDRTTSPDKAFRTPHLTRFKYASGLPVSHFIFGWDEARHWEQVVLVENTFNAIAWRDKLKVLTNFGSNLSNKQMNLLKYSKAKRVIFLWDKDAYGKAWKSACKLQLEYGIPTAVIALIGYRQPDEVPFHILENTIKEINESKAPHHSGPLIKEIVCPVASMKEAVLIAQEQQTVKALSLEVEASKS